MAYFRLEKETQSKSLEIFKVTQINQFPFEVIPNRTDFKLLQMHQRLEMINRLLQALLIALNKLQFLDRKRHRAILKQILSHPFIISQIKIKFCHFILHAH